MKNFAHLLVIGLFTAQSTLALPAQHAVQSQALEYAAGLEQELSSFDETAPEASQVLASEGRHSKWADRLQQRLETKGMKRYLKKIDRELSRSNLTDEQKRAARLEAEAQAQEAFPQIIAQARAAKNPFALIRTLKQNLKQARQTLNQARAAEAQSNMQSSAKSATGKLDRQPAQVRIDVRVALRAVVITSLALFLVLSVYGLIVLTLMNLMPILVVGVVIYIVV